MFSNVRINKKVKIWHRYAPHKAKAAYLRQWGGIIGSDNELVGYGGGLRAKRKLLELEKNFSQQELF